MAKCNSKYFDSIVAIHDKTPKKSSNESFEELKSIINNLKITAHQSSVSHQIKNLNFDDSEKTTNKISRILVEEVLKFPNMMTSVIEICAMIPHCLQPFSSKVVRRFFNSILNYIKLKIIRNKENYALVELLRVFTSQLKGKFKILISL